MTTRYQPSRVLQPPMAVQPIGYCRKCDHPRPRQRGRTLCWYCAEPSKRCTAEPTEIERDPSRDAKATRIRDR